MPVAISADGNTAIVGGPFDNSYMEAALVFIRSNNGVWSQEVKLVGSGAIPLGAGGCPLNPGPSVAH